MGGAGKQGRRAVKRRCRKPFLAALVSPFTPTAHRTIPPSDDRSWRNLLPARARNHIVASFQDADTPPAPAYPTLRDFVACMGLLGFRASGTRKHKMRLANGTHPFIIHNSQFIIHNSPPEIFFKKFADIKKEPSPTGNGSKLLTANY